MSVCLSGVKSLSVNEKRIALQWNNQFTSLRPATDFGLYQFGILKAEMKQMMSAYRFALI